MAIDYTIDYSCVPKEQLGSQGIMMRLKGESRAHLIIQLFREKGDDRPPSKMGFEFTRRTPTGDEETRVIVVQDLLDEAADLQPLEGHCQGCPANHTNRRFGCMGFIQYPIARVAETWLLDRLPVPDELLSWMLLKNGIEEFQYDGSSIEPLRTAGNVYFESDEVATRKLGAYEVDANQVFEMIFSVGHINPNHAALLLIFLNAIDRDLEADAIMAIAPAPGDVHVRHPFLLNENHDDNPTIAELKTFFHALYTAWTLDVRLILDV